MAGLHAADHRAALRPPQHPLLQRAPGLDPHQRHPQPGDVPVSTHGERHSLRDARPGESPPADSLGTDGLRHPVHRLSQIPHHLTHRSVHSCQFLHEIRPDSLPDQHQLATQRPPAEVASVPWSTDIWDQQILTPLKDTGF